MSWIEEAARAEFARGAPHSFESARKAHLARLARMSRGARPDPGVMCRSEHKILRQRQADEQKRLRAIKEAKEEEEKRRKFEEWAAQAKEQIRPHQISIIQKIVADHFGLSVEEMLTGGRKAKIVLPRQIAIYLARDLTTRTLPEIGRRFYGIDHTTVLHAIRKVTTEAEANPEFAAELEAIRQKVPQQPKSDAHPSPVHPRPVASFPSDKIVVDICTYTISGPRGSVVVTPRAAEVAAAIVQAGVLSRPDLAIAMWPASPAGDHESTLDAHIEHLRHGRARKAGIRTIGLDVQYTYRQGYRLVEMSP